jgi:hypothetical protein
MAADAPAAAVQCRGAHRRPVDSRGRLRLLASSPARSCKTDDVDFRARAHSDEEADFLPPPSWPVRGADLHRPEARRQRRARGFEPEEESPDRLLAPAQGVTKGTTKVYAVAPWASPGLSKLGATVLAAGPGQEIQAHHGVRRAHAGVCASPARFSWSANALPRPRVCSAGRPQTAARADRCPPRVGAAPCRGARRAGRRAAARYGPRGMGNGATGVGFAGVIEATGRRRPSRRRHWYRWRRSCRRSLVSRRSCRSRTRNRNRPSARCWSPDSTRVDVPDGAALVDGLRRQFPCVDRAGDHHNDATAPLTSCSRWRR